MPTRGDHIRALMRAVGGRTALSILCRRLLGAERPVTVRLDGHLMMLRPGNSDFFVAAQIFGSREYDVGERGRRRLNDLASAAKTQGKTPVIVDAGANVGYTSIFLADCFPDAIVFAVEPDEVTFRVAKQNCANSDRILPVHAALWNHDCGVTLRNPGAPSWARSVADGGATPSCTLSTLLRDVPNPLPLVLKLDIEGAEREVCNASPDIVRRFPCVLVESHDFMRPGAGCLSPLFSAIVGKDVDTLVRGENIFLIDSSLLA